MIGNLRNQYPALVKAFLLLLLISWQSGLPASEPAKIPLTQATPESQHLNRTRLEQAVAEIANGKYGDMSALLVLRNNYLVLEHYTSPLYYGRDYRQPAYSVTKSVTSALVGIARGQGKMPSLHSNLLELFPQYPDIANLDARKKQITLEHVLSMTAGFKWNQFTRENNSARKMLTSPDGIKYVLDSPMSHKPGEQFVYNDGCSILLSGILKRSTGQAVDEYANKYLFQPIGINNWNWYIINNEVMETARGLSMSRRDMARFGVLYLNGGRWQSKQIVPEEWIKESTSVHVIVKGDNFPYDYGYQWLRLQDQNPTAAMLEVNDAYFAWGHGGQFIFVAPHLSMVVVSTASNIGPGEDHFFKLLRDHIFPAVLD